MVNLILVFMPFTASVSFPSSSSRWVLLCARFSTAVRRCSSSSSVITLVLPRLTETGHSSGFCGFLHHVIFKFFLGKVEHELHNPIQRPLIDCPVQPVRGVPAQYGNDMGFLFCACATTELFLCVDDPLVHSLCDHKAVTQTYRRQRRDHKADHHEDAGQPFRECHQKNFQNVLHFVFLLLLTHPTALYRTGVDVYPASRTTSFYRVTSDAAGVFQQRFGVGRERFHVHALNPNICRHTVAMLTVRCALDRLVMGGSAICAGDRNSLSKVIPDVLQQFHQHIINKDGVSPILAAKLFHGKVCGQFLVTILCQ
ncbi:hypothetical protein 2204_scaffold14_00062 [Bacteriophage sp.]|nr:hypothetical protein 2204_scaffold14_00062 [Bacteriophage sp.]